MVASTGPRCDTFDLACEILVDEVVVYIDNLTIHLVAQGMADAAATT